MQIQVRINEEGALRNQRFAFTDRFTLVSELLQNARRAGAMRIEIDYDASAQVLRVEDDGVGYNFEEARTRGSMGLLNILSRASALGGAFVTERKEPHGTVALVRIPV